MFDGDQCSIRGVFTDEANEELRKFRDSKKNFIEFTGKNGRIVEGDSVHSLYCLTRILPADTDKITRPVFK